MLRFTRFRLGLVATDELDRIDLARSGWSDVLDNASRFHWPVWVGPAPIRLAWYREWGPNGMATGSLRELMQYVFTPVSWNLRLSVWLHPRRSRGGRGLLRRHENGWWIIG